MKIARCQVDSRIFYGVVEEKSVKEIEGSIFEDFKTTNNAYALQYVDFLPPVMPQKIIASGLNYKDHAEELNLPIPQEPILFLKPASSLIGNRASIEYPPSVGQLDYEAELAVIIKRRAKNISPKKIKDYILGYTCLNDVTARDLQTKDGQWTRSKSFDTFCPAGPHIVTDINPNRLDIRLLLNGYVKQSSNTKNLIFSPEELTSFISHIMTLLPGDIISTGTPGGVGPMTIGDEVTVEIERIGSLTNYVTNYIPNA